MGFESNTQIDPSDVLRSDLVFQGLTPKQEAYAQARFEGLTATEAFRQVYATGNATKMTERRDTVAMECHPLIVARVRQLVAEKAKATSFDPIEVDRNFVIQGVATLALTAGKDSDKLKAYELLGKAVGIDLFRDHVIHEKVERTPAQVEEQLREKLDAMRKTIDGEARTVPPGLDDKAPR